MVWKPDYITEVELRNWAQQFDVDDDDELWQAITAASRDVDRHCGRQFGSANGTRTYKSQPNYRTRTTAFDIDDLMDSDPLVVVVDGVTLTESDYTLEPLNAAEDGMPWTSLVLPSSFWGSCEAVITATPWGWSLVPLAVKLATKIQSVRFATRRDQAQLPSQVSSVWSDPAFFIALKDYRRPRRAR